MLVKATLALVLMVWLYRSGRLDVQALRLDQFGLTHVLGLLALGISMVFQATRWWLLVRSHRISISLPRAFALSWIGQFFSIVLPGAAGGELVRTYYITRHAPDAKVASASTVLVDRALGMYALLLLSVPALVKVRLAMPSGQAVMREELIVGVLTTGMTVGFGALFSPRFGALVTRVSPERFRELVSDILSTYREQKAAMLACFGLSILGGIATILGFVCATRIVAGDVDVATTFVIAPLVTIASSLPISPGGIGVAETASSVLYSRANIADGAAIMLLVRVWSILLRLPGGLAYVAGDFRPRTQRATTPGGDAGHR